MNLETLGILINELNNFGGEGGLFHGGPSQQVQTSFIGTIIEAVKPKSVIEIGTHRANFACFLWAIFPNVPLTTFGNDPKSSEAIEKVNQKLSTNYQFILGDSKKTFKDYKETADLIWVDGGHEYDVVLSDLENSALKEIRHILIDDLYIPEVRTAVYDFLKKYPQYNIMLQSPDVRQTVYISVVDTNLEQRWNYLALPFIKKILAFQSNTGLKTKT